MWVAFPSGFCGNRPAPRRRGIALIATLGLLAALIVLALGFAAFMRIERVAAGNFANLVKTRQLVYAALDTVVLDINQRLAPSTVWSNSPRWDYSDRVGDATNVVYGTASRGGTKHFLPLDFLQSIDPNPTDADLSVDWEPLEVDGQLQGVFAAVVVDESSRLDFNYAGRYPYQPTNQRNRAEHLYLGSNLSNIASETDWEDIVDRRVGAVRFYNPAEFKYTIGDKLFGSLGGGPNWINDAHFTTYARYAQYYEAGGTTTNRRAIIAGGPGDATWQESDIVGAFQADGLFTPTEANQLYAALVDYVDADSDPTHTQFETEAVPFISEVVVTNRLEQGPGPDDWRNTYAIGVELWYPFVGPAANGRPYQILAAAQYTGSQPPALNPAVALIDTVVSVTGTFIVAWSPPMTATVVTNGVDMSGASVEVAARLTGPGVGTYDLPTNVTFSMGSVLSLGTGVEMSSEVNDPRLNGSPTSWVINTLGSTIGTTNSISTPGDDGAVYIADSAAHGGIQNAGELGYLWIPGRPWESIDLMGAHAALLDRFTVHTNEFVHGLVNINSDDPQVLATALYGARNEICPGAESTGLSWPDALTLAATISANRPPDGYPAKSAIASLAEFSNETFGPQPTENHKESLVRLCSDMMDVRGNTHFVVLAVRAVRDRTSPSNDDPNGTWDGEGVDFTLGEQFAVAQVWRDPVTQQSQVTFFKWIARTD